MVRPEKLEIDDASRASTAGSASDPGGLPGVEGVVESSVYLGTSTQIVVDLGDDVRMTVLVPNASEAERRGSPAAAPGVG